MPSTIPYDPNLALGSVVSKAALQNVQIIAESRAPVDAAQDSLNSLISSKKSLAMTKKEPQELGIPTEALDAEINKLNTSIDKAAKAYAVTKIDAETQLQKLQGAQKLTSTAVESPVDYARSEVKSLPLAADTTDMEIQSFPFDSGSQDVSSYCNQVASYISGAVGNVLGSKSSERLAASASSQISQHVNSLNIEGLIVISAASTHKIASILAPFQLHIDKAVRTWNQMFPSRKLDPTSQASMIKIAQNESQEDRETFSIVSGMTFGSVFVGLIYILKSTSTSSAESFRDAASSLQASFDSSEWFAGRSGKIGIDRNFARNFERLFEQHNVETQARILTMGVNANDTPDQAVRDVLGPLTGTKTGLEQDQAFASSMKALSAIDDRNEVRDMNSMMSALDEYLKKAVQSSVGVPISYYLKDIDQKMLAQMWVAKYFPGQFMAMKYDDSEGGGPAGQQEKAAL